MGWGRGEGGGQWERELKEGVSQVPRRPSFSTCADQEDLRSAEAKSAAGVDRSINRNRIREWATGRQAGRLGEGNVDTEQHTNQSIVEWVWVGWPDRCTQKKEGGRLSRLAVPFRGMFEEGRKRKAKRSAGGKQSKTAKAMMGWAGRGAVLCSDMKSVKVANRRCNSRGQARAWSSDL